MAITTNGSNRTVGACNSSWYYKLVWLAAIWSCSVLVLFMVAAGFRLLMLSAGLKVH